MSDKGEYTPIESTLYLLTICLLGYSLHILNNYIMLFLKIFFILELLFLVGCRDIFLLSDEEHRGELLYKLIFTIYAFCLLTLISGFWSLIIVAFTSLFKRAYELFILLPKSITLTSIMSVILIITAILLYLIRLKFRSMYGASEILVGMLLLIHKINVGIHDSNGDTIYDYKFYLVLLSAGIYLVVRGLDNFYSGKSTDPLYRYISKKSKLLWKDLNTK